jgi:hypothetical protein
MKDGSCQTRAATRHAPPSPARPRTIPKKEAGTAMRALRQTVGSHNCSLRCGGVLGVSAHLQSVSIEIDGDEMAT